MATNYSILVGVELQTKEIEKQLNKVSKKAKINIDSSSVRQARQDINDLALDFNTANEVFSKATEVIGSLAEQVLELDTALTEYKKVSSLSGAALDDYVDKLSEIGLTVGRTGKPNRSEPVCTDGKCAQRTAPKPLKASRALQLQYEMRYAYMNVGNYYNCKDDIWWKHLSIVKKGRLGAKP